MNNFQRLEEEEINRFKEQPLDIIGNKVHNKLDNMRAMGGIVELYLTKLVDVFVMMTGGNTQRPNNTFSHTGGHGSPTEPDTGKPGGPAEK